MPRQIKLLFAAALFVAGNASAQDIGHVMQTLDTNGFDVGGPRDLTPTDRAKYTAWFKAFQAGGKPGALAAGARLKAAPRTSTKPVRSAPKKTSSQGGASMAQQMEMFRRQMQGVAGSQSNGKAGASTQNAMAEAMAQLKSLGSQFQGQQGSNPMADAMAQLGKFGGPQASQGATNGMEGFAKGMQGLSQGLGGMGDFSKMMGGASASMNSPYKAALDGIQNSLKFLEHHGKPVADLRSQITKLRGMTQGLDAKTAQVLKIAMSGREPPTSLTNQLESGAKKVQPLFEKLSETMAARMKTIKGVKNMPGMQNFQGIKR